MRKTTKLVFGTLVSILLVTSCQRNSSAETFVEKKESITVAAVQTTALASKGSVPGVCNPFAYAITLESHTLVNGNWEWVWSIKNNNPGNGNNGTAQDLSNWGMQLGSCVAWTSVVGAAYSGDGVSWTVFTPSYQVNPSQGCLTTPVVKFDFGTSGAAKSYYRLTLNQQYEEDFALGYYKSGSNTSCCTINFTGIGCGGPVEFEIVE